MKNKKGNHYNIGKTNGMFGVHRLGKDSPNFGKHPSKNTRKLISLSKIGKKRLDMVGINNPKFNKNKGINNPMFGKIGSWANKKNPAQSKRMKLLWKTKRNEFSKRILKSRLIVPNKPETLLIKLFKELKLSYKFVGDGKVILAGFNPDFISINGQKKIIELFGTYWHKRKEVLKRDKRRLVEYKKLGYKTLIVWEHELKNIVKIKDKLSKFNCK